MKDILTSMASIMGVMAFFQGLLTTIFPPQLRFALLNFFNRFSNYFSSYCYYDITEIDGVNTNELYNAVQLYLSSTASSAVNNSACSRLSLSRSVNSSTVTYGLAHNDTLYDTFNGVTVKWDHIVTQRPSNSFSWRPVPDEKRGFTLRVRKARAQSMLGPYLDHIVARSNQIRRMSQDRYLYTNSRAGGGLDPARPGSPWEAVPFKHPSTFKTLAMDPGRKASLMDDLDDFVGGESFYRATGRAWKRGYLLYGPPGTGKSSMIAAMANYLAYDVYDLELTEVGSNSELRKLLMKTTPKSIIVIEDIDCSLNLSGNRSMKRQPRTERSCVQDSNVSEHQPTVTLSGLLGFTDGLWSCCGSERIFVLTTNHVERIDPALMRSGRMDMHIHMGYCSLESLKILVKNYVGMAIDEIDECICESFGKVVEVAKMTPADVSEVLIRNRRKDKEVVVAELLAEMERRVERNERKMRGGGAGGGGDGGGVVDEVEEQEKRELEMTHAGGSGGGVVVEFEKDNDGHNDGEDDKNKFI